MKRLISSLGVALLFATPALALGDDFKRESDNRPQKDRLEGQTPPALAVTGWMNTDGKAIDMESLKGKVVVLDFWGTW